MNERLHFQASLVEVLGGIGSRLDGLTASALKAFCHSIGTNDLSILQLSGF